MSVPRPTGYLDWVTSNNPAYIQQPTSGQQNTGWVLNEAPPFEYMNWNENLTDQWIKYFDYVLTGGASSIAVNPVVLVTTGTLAIGSNTISALASTAGLVAGLSVSGTGVPAGAYITAVGSGTATLSVNATSNQTATTLTFSHTFATGVTVQVQLDALDAELNLAVKDSTDLITSPVVLVTTGVTTSGSTALTGLASTAGLIPGLNATGSGVPAGAYLVSVGSGTATMNVPATASASGVSFTFGQTYAVGSNVHATLAELDAQTTLITKDPKNISAASMVGVFTGASLVAGNPVATGVTSTAGLLAGMAVAGTGVVANTYIKSIISGTSFELNKPATVTGVTGLTISHAFAVGADVQTQLNQLDASVNSVRDNVVQIGAADSPYAFDATAANYGQSGVSIICDTSAGAIIINLPPPGATPQGFQVRVQANNHAYNHPVILHPTGGAYLNDAAADFVIKTNSGGVQLQWARNFNSWYASFLPRQFLADDGDYATPTHTFQNDLSKGMYKTVTGIAWAAGGARGMELESGNLHAASGFSSETDGSPSTPAFSLLNNAGMFNDAGNPGFSADGGADSLVRMNANGLVSGDLNSPIRWQSFTGTIAVNGPVVSLSVAGKVISVLGMSHNTTSGEYRPVETIGGHLSCDSAGEYNHLYFNAAGATATTVRLSSSLSQTQPLAYVVTVFYHV